MKTTQTAPFTALGLPLLVLLGGFVLRIHHLDRQSLWPDEVYSYVASSWTLAQSWNNLVEDHVPLYTLLLGIWRSATGPTAFSLRFLSLIFSTVMLPLTYVIAKRSFNHRVGTLGMLLLAISPFQVYYGQETVMYSLLGALGLLASWVLLRYLSRPPGWILAGEGLIYGLLLYTHYAGWFVLATHLSVATLSVCAGWVQGHRKPPGTRLGAPAFSWRWSISGGIGLALFLPWMLTHLKVIHDNLVGGTSRSLLDLVQSTFIDLVFGNVLTVHLDRGDPIDASVLRHLWWLAMLLPLSCCVAIWPRRVRGSIEIAWDELVGLLHATVPYALLLVLVQFSREFVSRYGFTATPWFTVLAAVGLWRLPFTLRFLGFSALLLFSAWGLVIYDEHPAFARFDFRSAVESIIRQQQPGDVVVVTAPHVATTYEYYRTQLGNAPPDVPLPSTIPMNQRQTEARLAELAAFHSRIWFLHWQEYWSDPENRIGQWLGAHALRESTRRWPGGLGVDLWLAQPPILASPPPEANLIDGRLGDSTQLVAYQLDMNDGVLLVTLFWQLGAPLHEDYTVFVHLIDPSGHRIAQADGRPYDGQYPSNQWPTGPIIRDPHRIPLDPCLAPGEYSLLTGLYVLKTMQRLGAPGHDSVQIPVHLMTRPLDRSRYTVLWHLPAALRLEQKIPKQEQPSCSGTLVVR